jgi:ribosomal protein S18 acetylase RimI-like enzyme
MKPRHQNLVLRAAHIAESRHIAAMSRIHIEYGLQWRWTPGRVRMQIFDSETMVLVATVNGELRGFAIMRFGETRAHLFLLAVEPGSRRTGIGRALLLWLEESVRTAGLQDIRVEVRANNVAAAAFYESLGFTARHRIDGYYDAREPALIMIKETGARRTPERGLRGDLEGNV